MTHGSLRRDGGAVMPFRGPFRLAALAAVGLAQGCTLFGPPVVPTSARERRANQSLYAARRVDESRLQESLEDDPTDVAALLQLADQARRRGDAEAARSCVDRAAKIAPESSLVRV